MDSLTAKILPLVEKFVQKWDDYKILESLKLLDENPELDHFLSNYTVTTHQTLYRGLHFPESDLARFEKYLNSGKIELGKSGRLKSDTLSSWTKSKRIANDFSRSERDEFGIVIQIHAGPGSVFLDLDALKKGYPNLPIREEQEVILNPGVYPFEIIEYWGPKSIEDTWVQDD